MGHQTAMVYTIKATHTFRSRLCDAKFGDLRLVPYAENITYWMPMLCITIKDILF